MNEEQTPTLSLKAAYAFGAAHGLEREMADVREMVIEWDSLYTSTLRRGYVAALLEGYGLFDAFKKEHWQHSHRGNEPPSRRKAWDHRTRGKRRSSPSRRDGSAIVCL